MVAGTRDEGREDNQPTKGQLLGFQPFFQQLGREFVQAGTAFLRQLLKLFYQVAFELDRERYQAERLIAFALLAPIHYHGRPLAESSGIGRLDYLAFDFLAFAFFEVGFLQGFELKW